MRTVQRVYLYAMSWTALVALSVGFTRLTGFLIAYYAGLPFVREVFARWAGITVIALPLFLGHALWIERVLRARPPEAQTPSYSLYVSATAAVALFYLLGASTRALSLSFQQLWGLPSPIPEVWWSNYLTQNAYLLWALLVLWYSRRLGNLTPPSLPSSALRWPRLLVLLVSLAGLGMALIGTIHTGAILLLRVVPPVLPSPLAIGTWWREPFAPRLAWTVVGWIFWGWSWYQHWAWRHASAHARSQTRQVYYFVHVGLGLALTLVALGYMARQGILWLLGEPLGPRHRWWPPLATAIASLITGAFVWIVSRHHIRKEWDDPAARWFHLTVGRWYTYVVCAVALGVTWWGAANVIRLFTTFLLPLEGPGLNPGWWRRPLSMGLAMLLVAAPVWIRYWRYVERVAVRADGVGQQERSARVRRVYLYGTSLIAGLVMFFYLGRAAYAIWLWVLGASPAAFWSALVNGIGPGGMAFLIWAYHLYVLRRDARYPPAAPEEARASLLAEREVLLRRLAEIEAQLQQLERPQGQQ